MHSITNIIITFAVGLICSLSFFYIPNILNKLFLKFIQDIIKENIGDEKQLQPIIGAIFLSSLILNILSVFGFTPIFSLFPIPFLYTFCTFCFAIGMGIYRKKIHFFTDFIPQGVPLLMKPFFFFIEFLGFLIKPITTGIRIFLNLTVSHLVVDVLYKVASEFGYIQYGTTIIFICIGLIELISACLQAYLFTNFIAIFMGLALVDHSKH